VGSAESGVGRGARRRLSATAAGAEPARASVFERELRFVSFNIPNLNYVEDEFAFDRKHPYRLPDEYEIRDALLSVRQMRGQVVRLYTFPGPAG
jgi:hypothetical protein